MGRVNKVESGKRVFGARDSMCKGPVAGRNMQRLESAREGTWLEQRQQRKADPEEMQVWAEPLGPCCRSLGGFRAERAWSEARLDAITMAAEPGVVWHQECGLEVGTRNPIEGCAGGRQQRRPTEHEPLQAPGACPVWAKRKRATSRDLSLP